MFPSGEAPIKIKIRRDGTSADEPISCAAQPGRILIVATPQAPAAALLRKVLRDIISMIILLLVSHHKVWNNSRVKAFLEIY